MAKGMKRAMGQVKAVVYARVSTTDQEKEGFSIPAQLKLLRGYAASKGLKVVQEFTDVETAKRAGRTNFTLMIEYLQRHAAVTTVLVEKTDRLYRNFRDYVSLEDLDLEIHLVKEGEVLSQDSRSHEKFIHGIKVLMAKNYIDNLSEEVKKGMAEKAAQGVFPHSAPVGYTNHRQGNEKVIVVDPEKAPFIRQMFEWYATGRFSLEDIRKKAIEIGFRPTNRGMRPISKSKVELILKNPFYTGRFRWDGEVHRGTHEPIITEELFEKVQATFGSHDRKRGKYRVHDFAFGGLMTCGQCGKSIVGELRKGRYTYYRCSHLGRGCTQARVREEALEGQFAEVVSRVSLTPEVAEWIRQALRESLEEERSFQRAETARITREMYKVKDRLDQAYLDKLDGTIPEDFWQEKSAEWGEEKARLQRELDRHERAGDDYLVTGARLLELSQRAHELYLTQPAAEKREFLRLLCLNYTLTGGKLAATYRQPFDILADMATEVGTEEPGRSPGSTGFSSLVAPTGFEPVSQG